MANASWKITGDRPNQVWFVSGNDVTGHLISFITGEGHEGDVQVPETDYHPDRVRAIIQAKANIVDQVNALHEGNLA